MADLRRKKPEKEKKENPNVKVTLTFDTRLLEKIDDYADSHYMSRSGMVAYACNQIFIAEETRKLLVDMNTTLQMIFKRAGVNPEYTLSDDERKELEQMEFTLKMISGEFIKNNPDLL